MWPKMLKTLNPVSYGASRMERPVVIDLAPVSFRSNIISAATVGNLSRFQSIVFPNKTDFCLYWLTILIIPVPVPVPVQASRWGETSRWAPTQRPETNRNIYHWVFPSLEEVKRLKHFFFLIQELFREPNSPK